MVNTAQKPPISDEIIAKTKEFLLSFGKASKKLSLYGHQSEGFEEFFEPTHQTLTTILKDTKSDLTLSVKPFDFVLEGDSVYHDDGQENSITYKLYRVGIRTITFEQKIKIPSLVQVGSLLVKPPMELAQTDLASLLWEAEIEHFSYLQLQSTGDGAEVESEDDTEDFQRLLKAIKQDLGSRDERHKINFRSLSTADLDARKTIDSAAHQRELTRHASPLSDNEIKALQDILDKERETLPDMASELMFFLLKHVHKRNELELLSEHILRLAETLFNNHSFYHLSLLMEEVFWAMELGSKELFSAYKTIFNQLQDKLGTIERMDQLLEYIEEAARLSANDRSDIRIFLTLFGTKLHDIIMQKLPKVSSGTRRILLGAIGEHAKGAKLFKQLYAKQKSNKDFLLDMVIVARDVPDLLDMELIQEFLSTKHIPLQTEALVLLAHQAPEQIAEVSKSFLSNAKPELQKATLEVLCRIGEAGIQIIFDHLQSKSFKRLSTAKKSEIYKLLGQTQNPKLIDWCFQILETPSTMFSLGLNKEKVLVLDALDTTGLYEVRKRMEEHIEKFEQPPKIKKEIEHAIQRFTISRH